jgi:hypothetical protein
MFLVGDSSKEIDQVGHIDSACLAIGSSSSEISVSKAMDFLSKSALNTSGHKPPHIPQNMQVFLLIDAFICITPKSSYNKNISMKSK